jgi:selenophosphate synthetase-related protein
MATLRATDSQLADRSNKALIGARQSAITAAVAITGGEAPTEAEYNLLVTAINAIITALEAHGLVETND